MRFSWGQNVPKKFQLFDFFVRLKFGFRWITKQILRCFKEQRYELF